MRLICLSQEMQREVAIMRLDTPFSDRHFRIITFVMGLLLFCCVAWCQMPYIAWTISHGVELGFDSGKAAIHICWTVVVLMIDSAAMSAWVCMRPIRARYALLFGIILFGLTFVAIPIASLLLMVLRYFVL